MPDATALRARSRFFHGWWIVAISFLSSFVSAGVWLYAFALLLKPMTVDLGWNRTQTAAIITLRTILMGAMAPVVGRLTDTKWGPCLMMTAGGVLTGLGTLGLAFTHSLWQFYLMGAVASLGMGLSSELVTQTVVAKWFFRKRGRATAIASMGTSFGGIAVVPLAQLLMSLFGGWRQTWVFLGVLTWLLIVPLSALYMRRSPRDMGLTVDGQVGSGEASPASAAGPARRTSAEYSWTLREALRSPVLWLLLVVFNLVFFAVNGTLYHLAAYVSDLGFGQETASLILFILATTTAGFKPIWGFIAEKVEPRICLVIAMTGAGTALMILTFANSFSMLLAYVLLYATAVAAWIPISNLVWANYYGPGFLGTIRGTMYPATVASTAVAPLFSAMVYDATGNYRIAFGLFAALRFISAILLVPARRPVPPGLKAGAAVSPGS